MSRSSRRSYTRSEVLAIYDRHPLRERAIVQRIHAMRGSLRGVKQPDLAVDPSGSLTDQNHIGGLVFVDALGRAAGVASDTRVLDLGAGLGGSARVLAALHGCHVHGLEFSPTRCREARRLTALVQLSHLVTFECKNFATAIVERASYDVLWNQSSWVHARDKQKFIRRWLPALRLGGCVATEDTYLLRAPATADEILKLRRLEDQWKSYLNSADEWKAWLRAEGLTIVLDTPCTREFLLHFVGLEATGAGTHSLEQQSWRDAIDLARAGVIEYRRMVAKEIMMRAPMRR